MELNEVIKRIDAVTISDKAIVAQLKHDEDGEPYQVWKIDCGNVVYILKEAKESEAETYSTILAALETDCIPALYQVISAEEKTFLLMEYAGRQAAVRPPAVHCVSGFFISALGADALLIECYAAEGAALDVVVGAELG